MSGALYWAAGDLQPGASSRLAHTGDTDAKVVACRLFIDGMGPKLHDVAALYVAVVVAGALPDQLVLHLQRLICQVGFVAATQAALSARMQSPCTRLHILRLSCTARVCSSYSPCWRSSWQSILHGWVGCAGLCHKLPHVHEQQVRWVTAWAGCQGPPVFKEGHRVQVAQAGGELGPRARLHAGAVAPPRGLEGVCRGRGIYGQRVIDHALHTAPSPDGGTISSRRGD